MDQDKGTNLKIEITKQPKDYTAIIISIAAILISIGFSIYSYRQLLPLQEANIVFSTSDIQISQNAYINPQDPVDGDVIAPYLNNIGKAPAKNIHFSVFSFLITSSTKVNNIFDDGLTTPLQPGEKINIGQIEVQYQPRIGSTTLNLKGEYLGLIFDLSYTDSLTGSEHDEFSMYKYIIGYSTLFNALTNTDYKIVYQGLLSSTSSSTDENLNQYLQKNPPI